MNTGSGSAPANETGLTERQFKFVKAFVGEANGDGTKSAKIAGYSGDNRALSSVASKNLRHPRLIQAIENERERLGAPYRMGIRAREKILFEIATDPGAKKLERLKAIELMCRLDGSFTERRIVEGRTEVTFADRREALRALLGDEEALQAARQLVDRANALNAEKPN